MNVCVLIDAWEPVWGGGQTHVWELSQRLVLNYHYSIDIFTRALVNDQRKLFIDRESYFDGKLKIFRIGPTTKFFNFWGRIAWLITVIIAVYKQHQKTPYSLLHAHAYAAAIPAKIISLILKVSLVFTVHGANNLDLNKKNPIFFMERLLLTQITYDQEISVSKSFLKYPNVNKNIKIIPNGVDLNLFSLRKIKKHKSKIFTILWVGRFDKVKAVDVLLRAFKQVTVIKKNVKLFLVGYGYEEQSLKKLSHRLGLDNYVNFTGKKSREDIVKYYHLANLFVLPSLSEGLSMTLLEAWAAKLPVIVTTVGDHTALVKNGHNGFLVPPRNSEQLAATILKATSSRSLKQMGLNGYNLVRTRYSWESAVKYTHEVYRSLVL